MFGRSLSFCSFSFSNNFYFLFSVLLGFMASDYLFSILKHFLIAYQFLYFCKIFLFSHIVKYRIDKSIFCFFQIVHKRLAARNILLDSLLEPKITGFGPDPASVEDNDSISVSHDISIILVDLTNRFHTAMILCPPSVICLFLFLISE